MAVFVYRNVNSTGALELARALNGKRIREVPLNLKAEDFLICWGSNAGNVRAKVLNNVALGNKYIDALKLKGANVPTIEVSKNKPVIGKAINVPVRPEVPQGIKGFFDNLMEMAQDFVEDEAPNFNSPVFVKGIHEFRDAVVNFANILGDNHRNQAPVAAQPIAILNPNHEWIGRLDNHVGGKDLLKPPAKPDYYVRKEDIVEEFRVHSFREKSIRAGKKAHREGFINPSPWVRSWDGGWQIKYEGVNGDKNLRNLAHSAVKALGLDFGAVDIGRLRNGKLIVLEVNRAPGIEGGTVIKYAEAIQRWMRGE